MNTLSQLQSTITRQAFRTLNRVVVPALDRGFGSPLPIGVGAVIVETTGRTSGLRRRVPLLSARLGDQVMVTTVRPDSQWFANLEADTSASVRVGGQTRDAQAHLRRGPLNVAVLTMS